MSLIAPILGKRNWLLPSLEAWPPSLTLSHAGHHQPFLQRDLSEKALGSPAEPMFGESDLAAARQEGFEEGHAAGLAEAANSRAAVESCNLEMIAVAMADARDQAACVADQAASALANTLLVAMKAVMPDLIRRSALNEVNAMLAEVLPGLSREPQARVEVSHEIADGVVASLASLAPELRDKIGVTGLHNMQAGEARVCWVSGQARRQPAQVWQAVMEALREVLRVTEAKESDSGDGG